MFIYIKLEVSSYTIQRQTIGTVGDAPAKSPKSATVNQVRSSRFTYSSQQKFALKVRVLPVRQFAVRSSLITNALNYTRPL